MKESADASLGETGKTATSYCHGSRMIHDESFVEQLVGPQGNNRSIDHSFVRRLLARCWIRILWRRKR